MKQDGRVTGVVSRADGGKAPLAHVVPGSAVVLATGGIGHLYAVTTNPPEANGNGVAIAAEAGAVIADAEFVQFHPTAIDIGRDPAPLATEALRGDGATLVNRDGRRFMPASIRDAELAPRDIVARGVFAEIAAGRGAFLDAARRWGRSSPERFPTVYAACTSRRHRPRHAAHPGRARPSTTTWAASGRMRAAAPRSPGCGPRARWPPPACTAPTGWPRTRCWRRSCSPPRIAEDVAGADRPGRRPHRLARAGCAARLAGL